MKLPESTAAADVTGFGVDVSGRPARRLRRGEPPGRRGPDPG